MTIKVLRPNTLIGDVTPAVGDVLDVPESVGHRHVKAGTAAVMVAVEVESADLAPPAAAESADASPRTGRRRAAATE